MQIQIVNKHAVKRYGEFRTAIHMVRTALEESAKFVKKIKDSDDGRHDGWQVPTGEDVDAELKKALADLDTLSASAKKYEKELMAKGWMV